MVVLHYVLCHSHICIHVQNMSTHTHTYSRGVEALVLEPSASNFFTCGSLFIQRGKEGDDVCQPTQHFALA